MRESALYFAARYSIVSPKFSSLPVCGNILMKLKRKGKKWSKFQGYFLALDNVV